jgi:hypothetical protein
MILVLTSKLSTYGPLHRTLQHPNAEGKIKEALAEFFGASLENIFITLVDRNLTIRILEISSIDVIRYTLRISVNLFVSMCKHHKSHSASEICCIYLNARIEQPVESASNGCTAEPTRQETERAVVEMKKPALEPFVPIRQEQDLRTIQSSLRIEIPNGPSVSFGVNVNMVIYPHVAEPEDFQHTVSRCRINDERILNSPSKRQRVEEQEMLVLLPHADEITLEMLRRSCLETREISREILSFLEILRGGLIKFSRHMNPIQFMFSDFKVSYVSTTTLECIHWSTDISYETYRRSVDFITEVKAFITTIINQYL